jgi:hypothetical protein
VGFFFLLVLIFAGGAVSQAAGFPEAITRAIRKAAGGMVERMLFGFVFKRSYDNFIALHDLTTSYIAETDDLVRAIGRRGDRAGEVTFERMSGKLTLDSGGGVRLLYDENTTGPVVEAEIDLSGFKKYVAEYLHLSVNRPGMFRGNESRGSVALFLFDRRKLTFASLFNGPDIVKMISSPKYVSGRPSVRLSTRGLLLSMPLDRADGDITLVALYPYRLVRGAVYTFGLIAIIILTILLLWLIVIYTTAYYRAREVGAMSEQDKRSNIINEIDQELTSGEKKKHPAETRKEGDSGGGKDSGKQLEEDGIYIGK